MEPEVFGGMVYWPDGQVETLESSQARATKEAMSQATMYEPETSAYDDARSWMAQKGSDWFGLDPYTSRSVSEKMLGRPFDRPQADALTKFGDSLGLLGAFGADAPVQLEQGRRDAAAGNYGSAALNVGGGALGLLGLGALGKGLNITNRVIKDGVANIPNSDFGRNYVSDRLKSAQSSWGPIGKSVDVYEPEGYRGMNMFMTPEGNAGFAVKPDGEIASVVKEKGADVPNFSGKTLSRAEPEGGNWLNAFDTALTGLYGKGGFQPEARIRFNEDVARSDWGNEAVDDFMAANQKYQGGRPDLVFMSRNPADKTPVQNTVGGLDYGDDWEAANAQIKKRLKELGYGD